MDAVYDVEYTPVLKNLLNLRHREELDMAVSYFSLIRMDELKFIKLPDIFNLKFFKDLHKYIFGDVFEWAGEIKDNKSEEVSKLIHKTNTTEWLWMNLSEKARQLTDFLFDLTNSAPYLYGSFQAALTYVGMFAKSKGFALDQPYIDSKAMVIDKYIELDGVLSRERTADIVVEAMAIAFAKENTTTVVAENIAKANFKPVPDIVDAIKRLNETQCKIHTVNEIYDLYKHPERLGDEAKKIVSEISDGFMTQEVSYTMPSYKTKEPEFPQVQL